VDNRERPNKRRAVALPEDSRIDWIVGAGAVCSERGRRQHNLVAVEDFKTTGARRGNEPVVYGAEYVTRAVNRREPGIHEGERTSARIRTELEIGVGADLEPNSATVQ